MNLHTCATPAPAAFRAEPRRVGPASGGGAEHWADLAAAKAGLASLGVVQGIWNAHGFQPNGARQLLGDSQAAAVCAIVDLHLRPPADAVVLTVDEKGQIPVTGRTLRDSAALDDVDPGGPGTRDPSCQATSEKQAAGDTMTHPPDCPLPSVSLSNVCPMFPGRAARWMGASCRLRRRARCRLTPSKMAPHHYPVLRA